MTGLIICAVIAGFSLGVLGVAVVYFRGFCAGYEKAQTEMAIEMWGLVEEMKQPLSHVDYQRAAGKAGWQ